MNEEKNLDKQEENKDPEVKRDEKGRILPGYTANPNGRPKGKSIRERIRQIFDEQPELFETIVQDFINDPKYRVVLWQMLEGLPKQTIGLDEPIEKVKIEIVKGKQNGIDSSSNNDT